MNKHERFAHNFARELASRLDAQGHRLDAKGVSYVQRALTHQAETIISDFGPLRSEELAPLNTSTPDHAEFVSHPILTETGRARIVANDAGDLPIVGIELDDNISPLFTVACAWLFNWVQQRDPANINKLQAKRQSAADAIARALDEICMVGFPAAGLGGFLNNPSVPVHTLPTGSWATATPAQILEDLRSWEAFVIATSGEGGTSGDMYPNTLALPGAEISYLRRDAGVGENASIWTVFSGEQSMGVFEGKVQEWSLIRTSYAEEILGTRRGTMYHRSPEVLVCENPLPFEELPPQDMNLQTKTPVVSRTGSVIWKKPAFGAYAAVG